MYFIGHTRFSEYHPKSKAWNISNFTEEEYIQHLFSDKRLSTRMSIFAGVSVPQLAEMKKSYDYRHIVAYSSYLPEKWKKILCSLQEKYPFLYLHESDTANQNPINILLKDKPNGSLAFFRLDDDDLLATEYLDYLSNYNKEPFKNMAVSFTKGVIGYYENNVFTDFRFTKSKNYIAIGQAYLGVWSNGKCDLPPMYSHHELDEHIPVIVDARNIVYIHTHHELQDTNYRFSVNTDEVINNVKKQITKFPRIKDTESLKQVFPHLTDDIYSFEANKKAEFIFKNLPLIQKYNFIGVKHSDNKTIFEIEYDIDIVEPITSTKALIISFDFEDNLNKIDRLTLSSNIKIGWYRYVLANNGNAKGTISFTTDRPVKIKGINVILWDEKINTCFLKEIKLFLE